LRGVSRGFDVRIFLVALFFSFLNECEVCDFPKY